MERVFLWVLNQSIAAGWLVLAVLALRLVFRRASAGGRCALWGLVGLRLLLPPVLESSFSLIPSAQLVSPEMLYAAEPTIDSGISSVNAAINPAFSQALSPSAGASVNPIQVWTALAGTVWLVGVAAMLLWGGISCLVLRKKTAQAVCLRDHVYLCDHVASPFLFGLAAPRIVLPSDLPEESVDWVLAHERAHLRRGDHIAKPVGYLLLSLFWFHPLMWLAYGCFCRDIELACDARVLRGAGPAQRKAYAAALIDCAAPHHGAADPLAFGESGVKTRVKAALEGRSPAVWLTALALAAGLVTAACFLTNPEGRPLLNEVSQQPCLSASVESPLNRYDMTSPTSTQYVQELLTGVHVGRAAVSQNRSDSREKTHTLTLRYETSAIRYHFDRTFTQVWTDDGVKPSLTYPVLNPALVRQFFQSRIETTAGEAQ